MTSQEAAVLDYKFSDFIQVWIIILKMMRKQYLVIEIYKKIESIVKLSVFSHF